MTRTRSSFRPAVLLSVMFASVLTASARQAFDHYRIILQRQPFGRMAKPAPPRAAPTPAPPRQVAPLPTPQWAPTLKLFAIEKKKRGTIKVGLRDTKTKRTYFISVGEADDFYVIEADYAGGKALIEKEGREYWYNLDGTFYEKGSDPENAKAVKGASTSAARKPPGRVVRSPGVGGGGMTKKELEKRRRRLAGRDKTNYIKKTEPPEIRGAVLDQHLKNYQMDLIRAGGSKGPPLPIPLTDEMDRQLVDEGVLPPLSD